MSKNPKPNPRPVGRPANDDTMMYVHFEAMRRLQGRPLNGVFTSTLIWSLRPAIELNSVVGEPRETTTFHRRFYAIRKRLAAADAPEREQVESLIESTVEFLRTAGQGSISAQ